MPHAITSLLRARIILGTLLCLLAVATVGPAAASGSTDPVPPRSRELRHEPAPAPESGRSDTREKTHTSRHRRDLATYTRSERRRIDAARDRGCAMAQAAFRASRKADIPFYVACAFLKQETGGGRNVFGHDASIFAGAGKVTKAKYLRYKRLRERTGRMQGVGPMQLTWHTFQDRADRIGGAWDPYVNMLVGFRHLADLRRDLGSWHGAARAYNGSGPMAQRYAAEMSRRFVAERRVLV